MSFAFRCLVLTLTIALLPARGEAQTVRPENQKLTTKDGVELAITYWQSPAGRNATPVVLLHDYKETSQSYRELANRMANPDKEQGDQHEPLSVVTIDLRGHGESITQSLGGRTRELSAAKLRAADYGAMVTRDMEAVRKFLVDQNDSGKLNLNRLSVMGVGMGAAVGTNWTAADWAAPPLATGKQGQDVKSLVVVSPRWKTNGLSVQRAVQQPGVRRQVAVLMLYGADSRRVTADVERIYKQLTKDRSDASANLPEVTKRGAETALQGAEWLKQAGDAGEKYIIEFLVKNSVKPDYPWSQRRSL